MFAAPSNEANRTRSIFQIANESPGNSLFGEALRFFLLGADLNDCRTVIFDSGFARQLRLLVYVDVIDMNFRRKVRVLIELILRPLESRRLVVIRDGRRLLQFLDDLRGLLRQAVALVRGRVVGLVVAVREN